MWGLQPIMPDGQRGEPGQRPAGVREPIAGMLPSMDLERSESIGPVKVEVTQPDFGEAELWLHNRGSTDFGEVKLRCVNLVADSGSANEGVEVTFDPVSVEMPSRSSRGLTVTAKVVHDAVTGVYRGLVVLEGHPQLCVPLVVTIRSAVD
jgi:hypothetical protein